MMMNGAVADGAGCVYVDEKFGRVRAFEMVGSGAEATFQRDDSISLFANNGAGCPETVWIEADFACDGCRLGDYGVESNDSVLFQLAPLYRNWAKFEAVSGTRVVIEKNGEQTSVYASMSEGDDRNYVALSEFCFQFGCKYGYKNNDDKNRKVITVRTEMNDGFVAEARHMIGSQEYYRSILKNEEYVKKDEKLSADVVSRLYGDAGKIGGLESARLGVFNEADVIVPVRFLAEGLNYEVVWDGKTKVVGVNDLAPEIDYEKGVAGKFIYVNNPEGMKEKYLADGPEKKLLYRDDVNGAAQIYYEHSTGGLEFYYGVRFSNTGNAAAKLDVLGCGVSHGGNWDNTWKMYNGNVVGCVAKTTYSIGAGETLWLIQNGSKGFVANSTSGVAMMGSGGFDGVLDVRTDRRVDVAMAAFRNLGAVEGAEYNGNIVDDDKNNTRVYSGSVDMAPVVKNGVAFTIDDDVPKGDLTVKVAGKESTYWATNFSARDGRVSAAVGNDILPIGFFRENGVSYVLSGEGMDPLSGGMAWNVANWSVRYEETVSIRNVGNKDRTLAFYLGTPRESGDYTLAVESDGKYTYGIYGGGSKLKVWEIEVGGGETKTVRATVTLGGMSNGGLAKRIEVVK
jgi:hypothetical protein